MTRGILFSQMEPPAGWEAEFRDWYERDHIPARMAIAGFAGATRYEAIDGEPWHLAVYSLDDLDGTLASAPYQRLKADPSELTKRMLANVRGFTRYTGREIGDSGPGRGVGDFLSVVAFDVPPEDLAAFDDWYETEHVPLLLEEPAWLRVRRYEVTDAAGGTWNRLALHELVSTDAMASPARARARQGPKREALADRPWFGHSGRWLYRAVSRHAAAAGVRPVS